MQTQTMIYLMLLYGFILSLVFGLSDRRGAHYPSSLIRMSIFLIPAIVGVAMWFESGRTASGFAAALVIYAIPAIVDAFGLVIFSKMHGRWLLATLPFLVTFALQLTRYGFYLS